MQTSKATPEQDQKDNKPDPDKFTAQDAGAPIPLGASVPGLQGLPPLYPPRVRLRARAMRLCDLINAGVQDNQIVMEAAGLVEDAMLLSLSVRMIPPRSAQPQKMPPVSERTKQLMDELKRQQESQEQEGAAEAYHDAATESTDS
jgi:hypothetical protein